jgi:hypothetical protein
MNSKIALFVTMKTYSFDEFKQMSHTVNRSKKEEDKIAFGADVMEFF